MKSSYLFCATCAFIFWINNAFGQFVDDPRMILPTDQNLFYGNENIVLSRLYWMGDDQIVGLRYKDSRPKDLVLMNTNRLIVDSLSINRLFLENFNFESGQFISINGIVKNNSNTFLVIHNFGTTQITIKSGKFELVHKKISRRRPDIPPNYFQGYEFIELEQFTIGYKVDVKKWLKSADFWVYNWETNKFSEYRDSEFNEESNNPYWDLQKGLETVNTFTQFIYNISKTENGLIFNLPLKNRFIEYDAELSTMQGYLFPSLEKKSHSRFVFYDWAWKRYFSVLDTGSEYKVFALDKDLKNYHLIAIVKDQPLEFNDGKVYFREIIFKKGTKNYYIDHYLGDLYPEIR